METENKNINFNINEEPVIKNNEDPTIINNDEPIINENEIPIQPENYDVNEIYNFLKDSGIAPEKEAELEFKSIQDLSNYISQKNNQIIEDRLKSELQQYPSQYQDLFEYLRNGGKVENFVNNYETTYSEIDISVLKNNIDLQKQVIEDYYRSTTQWNDKLINMTINKYSDDEIKDLSKNMLEQLKTFEYQSKEELFKQQQKEQNEYKQYQQNLIMNYNKEIDQMNKIGDLELTIKDKSEIKDLLFSNKTYNKLSSNFDKYRLQLSILDKYGLLDDINKLSMILNTPNKNKNYNFKKNNNGNTNNDILEMNLLNSNDNKEQKMLTFRI